MSKPLEAKESRAAVPNLALRQKNTAEVLTGCQEVREVEDGYSLSYPPTARWRKALATFAEAWGVSAPEMRFEVAEQDGKLWLHITGPEGTKQFVEGARYMMTSHINPPFSLKYQLRQAARYATSPLRVLPDFLIIGAKKCGTTALYSYLTQHPGIAHTFKKEIYFFNAAWGKGLHWYRMHFPTVFAKLWAKSVQRRPFLCGEATPDYIFQEHSIERIQRTIPKVRLFAILRNPVDRAYSFYNHNLRAGLEKLSFEEAIEGEAERLASDREALAKDPGFIPFHLLHHSYMERGIYVDQLQHWSAAFGKDQLQVIKSEDLYEHPERTLRRAFEFLGLDYHQPEAFKRLNTAPYPDMDPATRAKLEERFEADNRRLYEFLGEDLGW